MTILKQAYPDASLQVVAEALSELVAPTLAFESALGGTDREILEPIPVYTMSLEDAAERRLPTQPISLRFLVMGGGGSASTVDVDTASSDGEEDLTFNRLTEGGSVDQMIEALALVDSEFAEGINKDYEIRILEVPAINFGTIWLWSTNESVFIPYLDQDRLHGMVPAVENDFLERAASAAESRDGSQDKMTQQGRETN